MKVFLSADMEGTCGIVSWPETDRPTPMDYNPMQKQMTREVAAACAGTGADLYPITQELFDTNTLGKLKLQSYIADHARFLCGGLAAVCAIPKELEDTVTREDMEGVPGFLRSIEGVKIAATIRQTESGSKMSVRAVPGYDAARVCSRFGGGGHKGAAGAGMDLPLEEAVDVVARALVEAVEGV